MAGRWKTEKQIYDRLAELSTTLGREASAEFEEKKSVFIGHAKPIRTEEEALAFVKEKKKQHADATHNVFAYIFDDGRVAKYSDDGEPQGTAGMPVLDTIKNSVLKTSCSKSIFLKYTS